MTVPEGYHYAFDEDWFRPWICDRCGASVVASAFEAHDAWHAWLDRELDEIDDATRTVARAFNSAGTGVRVGLHDRQART